MHRDTNRLAVNMISIPFEMFLTCADRDPDGLLSLVARPGRA